MPHRLYTRLPIASALREDIIMDFVLCPTFRFLEEKKNSISISFYKHVLQQNKQSYEAFIGPPIECLQIHQLLFNQDKFVN